MVMRSVRPRKTVDDYMRLPEEARVELIDGEFYVSPSPNRLHQRAVLNIAKRLDDHVKSRTLGEVLLAPFDCILSPEDVLQPDVLFVSALHLDRFQERLHGSPDLAIEVLSATHAERDRVVKRDRYAFFGVPEFWIVDPDAKTVEVMRLENGSFRLIGIFEGDERIASPSLPGLDLTARMIFE